MTVFADATQQASGATPTDVALRGARDDGVEGATPLGVAPGDESDGAR